MKVLLMIAIFSLATASLARAETDYAPECRSAAKSAVATAAKTSRPNVKLFNASLLGDGASAVEAMAFTISGDSGFWIVTMNYDGCSVLQSPVRIHN